MQDERRVKLVNLCNWLALIAIALYSYFSSMYLSSFAELHITIPKINLPVFAGEILLSLVALLAGLVFFLKKDKTNLVQLIKKYWFIAVFFIFIIIKAFLGLYRHGFLAFRNAAMFYYLTFAFLTYYFYRPQLFKPLLRRILLAILIIAALFSHPIAYFLYTYYVLILILLLKERGRPRTAGFILFSIALLRNEHFFVQSKAALISLGVVLMYLISNFIIYLYGRVKNRKIFTFSLILIFIILFTVCNFMMNTDLYKLRVFGQIKDCLNLKSYPEQYNTVKERVNSYLESGKYTLKAELPTTRLYQKNFPKLKGIKDLYKEKVESNSFLEKTAYEKIDTTIKALPQDISNTEKAELTKEVLSAAEEVNKEIVIILANSIDEVVEKSFKKDDVDVVSKEIISSKEEKVQKIVEKKLSEKLPQGILPEALKTAVELVEAEAKDNLAQNALVVARQIVNDNKLERSSEASMSNIMWRVFVWKDMLEEVAKDKKTLLLGMDFGYPFRSKSAEIMNWSDGSRVGWLEPHNSYIHIFYRAGIAGIALIVVILGLFIKMALYFTINKNITGIMLTSALLYWLCLSCFMVVLEMPYYAIPFWSLFGATLKYRKLSMEINAA